MLKILMRGGGKGGSDIVDISLHRREVFYEFKMSLAIDS